MRLLGGLRGFFFFFFFSKKKKNHIYTNLEFLHYPTTKVPREVMSVVWKIYFIHKQINHHTHRNFGDWIMQQPQINIYEKKNRRTSEYMRA